MSTFYAVLENLADARMLADELLRSGLRPDDLSLLSKETNGSLDDPELPGGRTGDATAFVGREDDPIVDDLLPVGPDITDKTSVMASPLMGVDTSDRATDVEMVDQSDDSQTYAEDSIEPYGDISQAEHEKDDLVLATETGFPTPVPVIDDIRDTETHVEEQNAEGLETMVVPGVGTVMGGGSLATAAIGFTDPSEAIVSHLVDEGMTPDRAEIYAAAYRTRMALLAVHIDPGATKEEAVEEYVARHKVHENDLVDAPRFYENGGRAKML